MAFTSFLFSLSLSLSLIGFANLPSFPILNKSFLLLSATFIPRYPRNKYNSKDSIPPTIGILFTNPLNKYAITNPTIRPIDPNNISV